jgi:hypothetical protein
MEDRLFIATMDPMACMQQKQLSSGALSLIIQQQKDAAAVSLGAAIAGVFDGHGGGLTAQHAATFIPELVAGGLSGQGVRPAVPGNEEKHHHCCTTLHCWPLFLLLLNYMGCAASACCTTTLTKDQS